MNKHINSFLLSTISLGFLFFGQAFAYADNSSEHEEISSSTAAIPFDETPKKVRLIIQINVPFNNRAQDHFTASPYPVELPVPPPKFRTYPLSTNDQDLKNVLKSLGYIARTKVQMPYPAAGWRYNIAFQRAVKRFKGGQPHTLSELYRWLDEILPYFKDEIQKSNEIEIARTARANEMREKYPEERAEVELTALKQGLFPAEIHFVRSADLAKRTEVFLPAAKWWIVGTHKVPGLTYYWQETVDLSNGDQVVQLHPGNALFIEGAW